MFNNTVKIKTPKQGHYYVMCYRGKYIVVKFISQACWNLTFQRVDDSYLDKIDGEFVNKHYSIIFK